MTITVHQGDCLERMAAMRDAGERFSAIVTDPPYHLTQASRGGSLRTNNPETPFGRHHLADKGFMGKQWDGGDIAMRPETWRLALDVLEPGGMLAAFGGSRTHHRMACAIEDAGFEIRDQIMWLYGTGLPKSKALLKPAYEAIILARKPGPLRMLNIDGCRVEGRRRKNFGLATAQRTQGAVYGKPTVTAAFDGTKGCWPANILHDGSDEALAAFAAFGNKGGGDKRGQCDGRRPGGFGNVGADRGDGKPNAGVYSDTGTAARFFYAAKASKIERAGSTHPTVKPLSLMRWLVRLVTPPGGMVLDPFSGTGTTLEAAMLEGFGAVGIEQNPESVVDIHNRLGRARERLGLFASIAEAAE